MHWVQPTIITTGLALGVGLAIAHHIYYHTLDGTIVADRFQQTWAIRYGSILAIATRVSFSACLGTSIVQLFWWTFQKPSKTTSMKTVDRLFDITRNPLGFFSWQTWAFSPLLVFLGLTAWLLPIIVVVAPATLTVVLAPSLHLQVVSTIVPELDWTRAPGNFCEFTYTSSPLYYGPHIELQRLALSTANSGAVQALSPANVNSSYELTFYGPSLECHPYPMEAPATTTDDVVSVYVAGVTKAAYFATAPLSNGTANMTTLLPLLENLAAVPRSNLTNKYATSGFTGGEGQYYAGLDALSTDAARFWVFVNPFPYPEAGGLGRRTLSVQNYTDGDAAMQCTLYNSSYTVGFNFSSGTQTLTLRSETKLNTVAYVDSMMDRDEYRPEVYPTMNYQAVMHAVGKLVMGWLEGEWDGGDGVSGPSRVPFTSLVHTIQFDYYRKYYEIANLSDAVSATRNHSIAYALEDTMRNVTFSLFSSSRFLRNSASATPVSMTVGTPQNMWQYTRANLLAVYGAASLLAALGALAGWASLRANGWASFAASPSTFVRASRASGPALDRLVRARDTRAAAPLPPRLGRARVHFVPVPAPVLVPDRSPEGWGDVALRDEERPRLVGVDEEEEGADAGRWAIAVESDPLLDEKSAEDEDEDDRARKRSNMTTSTTATTATTMSHTPSPSRSRDRFDEFQESWEGYNSQYGTRGRHNR